MPLLLSYCLKFSVSIALVFLFYQLVLRKLTFYNWNRYYLLGYSLLSFVVAFIDISPLLQQNEWSANHLVQIIPVLNSSEIISNNESTTGFFAAWNSVALLLLIGVIIMFARLMIQLFSFHRMMKKAELVSVGEIRFYQVNESIIPFSFGRSIFINRDLHTEEELGEIIRHEFVHVKQNHSIDIIAGELLCLFNWYNPFAWLLKAAIRQNLEFIADNKILENGINKKEYQYLLLKVVGNNQFSIAQKFNFSSLKKRIAMMNKLKSARLNLVRFLFVLPFVAVLLLAFRNKGSGNSAIKKVHENVVSPVYRNTITDTTPKPSRETKEPKETVTEKNLSRVSTDFEITDDRAVIHLKNGETEEYDLKNKEQREKFEKKYGKIINTNVHNGPMSTISVVTAEGVKTAIAPANVVTANGSATIAPVNVVTAEGNTTIASSVSTNAGVATTVNGVPVTSVGRGTTVIAPMHPTTADNVRVYNVDEPVIEGKEEVLVTITKSTSRQQLDDYKKQMKEKGIELNYDEIEYDNSGNLVRLSGTLKSKDGSSNFVASSFGKLTLSMIRNGDRSYFKVHTTNYRVTL